MAKRHLLILGFAGLAAAAVVALLVVSARRRIAPAPVLPPGRPIVDHGSTPIDGRAPLAIARLFGKAGVYGATTAPYWLGEDALTPRACIEVPPDAIALVATPDGDELLLRAGARVRGWREGDKPVLQLEAGEVHLRAGARAWDVRTAPGDFQLADAACGFRLDSQTLHIAVARGAAHWVSRAPRTGEPRSIDIHEGEVVQLRDGKIGGSMSIEPGKALAWVRAVWDARNLLRDGTATLQPNARYLIRGRAASGPLTLKLGGATISTWASPPADFRASFATRDTGGPATLEGALEDGVLVELGGD